MPKLIKLYIVSVATGFALSAVFLVLLIWQDVAGLRHLIWQSDMRWTAVIMMIVMNGVVFSGVQFAIAVMSLADDDHKPTDGDGFPPYRRVRARVTSAVGKVAGPQRP
jgi:hypothetical protein